MVKYKFSKLTPQQRWNRRHPDLMNHDQQKYWAKKRAEMTPIDVKKYDRKYCLIMRERRKNAKK